MILKADLERIKQELYDATGYEFNITSDSIGNSYHNEVKVTSELISFNLTPQWECGIVQFSHYTFSYKNVREFHINNYWVKIFPVLKKFMKELNPKVGAYYTVLGDDHKSSCEKFLNRLGFKQVAEYNNPVHGKDYCQRMYILDMKDWDKIHQK